jgi:hypothetical protein
MKFDFEKDGDVHTRHCCIEHGCRYGEEDCSVVTGRKPQEFPCEDCDHESSPKVLKATRDNTLTLQEVEKSLRRQFGREILNHPSSWGIAGFAVPPETVPITRDEYKAIHTHLEWLKRADKALQESEDPFYRGAGIITELANGKEK